MTKEGLQIKREKIIKEKTKGLGRKGNIGLGSLELKKKVYRMKKGYSN